MVSGAGSRFSYSWWSNYGSLIYGLLFPLLLIAWLLLTPTKITYGEWGISLLALYYAYQLGMVWYCLCKTPLQIEVTDRNITFTFLGGKAVSWAAAEVDEIEKRKCAPLWFADYEIVVTRNDAKSALIVRPEVKGGEQSMLEAFRQLGITVRDNALKEEAKDG